MNAVNDPGFEILWDGRTVWVNGVDGLLGRFDRRRMDVHADNRCTRCGPASWETFTAAMLDVHGITIPDQARPLPSAT